VKKTADIFIVDKKDRILLLRRSMDDYWCPGKWCIPGGMLDAHESALEGGIRETKEETNLNVKDLKFVHSMEVHDNDLDINVFVTYFITRKYEGHIKLSNEHIDYEWVDLNDLHNYDCIPMLKQIVEGPLSDIL